MKSEQRRITLADVSKKWKIHCHPAYGWQNASSWRWLIVHRISESHRSRWQRRTAQSGNRRVKYKWFPISLFSRWELKVRISGCSGENMTWSPNSCPVFVFPSHVSHDTPRIVALSGRFSLSQLVVSERTNSHSTLKVQIDVKELKISTKWIAPTARTLTLEETRERSTRIAAIWFMCDASMCVAR